MLVRPLTGSHNRQGFDCGRQELNDWLRQVARQHQDKGLSKTFVATCEEAPDRICAYYALTLAELENSHLPEAEALVVGRCLLIDSINEQTDAEPHRLVETVGGNS